MHRSTAFEALDELDNALADANKVGVYVGMSPHDQSVHRDAIR